MVHMCFFVQKSDRQRVIRNSQTGRCFDVGALCTHLGGCSGRVLPCVFLGGHYGESAVL